MWAITWNANELAYNDTCMTKTNLYEANPWAYFVWYIVPIMLLCSMPQCWTNILQNIIMTSHGVMASLGFFNLTVCSTACSGPRQWKRESSVTYPLEIFFNEIINVCLERFNIEYWDTNSILYILHNPWSANPMNGLDFVSTGAFSDHLSIPLYFVSRHLHTITTKDLVALINDEL